MIQTKTLHYSIIATLMFVFFFTFYVENSHDAHAVCVTINGTEECSIPPPIITSIQSYYTPAEAIHLVGVFRSNSMIQVDLVDPNNDVKNSVLFQSDSSGRFQNQIVVPVDAINGTWKINTSSGITHSTHYITVISKNLQQNPSAQNGGWITPPQTHDNNGSNLIIHNETGVDVTGKILPPHALYSPESPVTITSPLKQFKSGVAVNNVKCKENLQLMMKSESSFPACVKPDTAQKLVERGWALAITSYTQQNIPALSSSIAVPNTNFTINYGFVGNGKILDANMDIQSKSLILSLETTSNGTLTVSIPRALLDIKKNDRGMGEFYILADGRETIFKEIHTSPTDRIFSIPFQNGTKNVEIIATELI